MDMTGWMLPYTEEVRRKLRRVLVSLAVVCVALGFVGVWRLGVEWAEGQQQLQARARSERDSKVLAVIVKRNPQATIREFSDFPGKLIIGAGDLNLDFRYIMALIDKESEWKPQAVSPAGAIGLMQVMPETAAIVVKRMGWHGYEPPSPNRASPRYNSLGSLGDPVWNLRVGMQYLQWQIDEYGLGPEHLRAYNRGGTLARAYWPRDRYAEDIGFRLIALVNEVK